MNRLLRVPLGLGLAALSACGGGQESESPDAPVRPQGSGIIVSGAQLEIGGTLLNALAGRVSTLRVERGGRCPRITFRGARAFGSGSPSVYIDRNRFGDTCVLDQVRPRHVSRVEIYPGGHTSRPGYAPDPDGLILIFLRRTAEGTTP